MQQPVPYRATLANKQRQLSQASLPRDIYTGSCALLKHFGLSPLGNVSHPQLQASPADGAPCGTDRSTPPGPSLFALVSAISLFGVQDTYWLSPVKPPFACCSGVRFPSGFAGRTIPFFASAIAGWLAETPRYRRHVVRPSGSIQPTGFGPYT